MPLGVITRFCPIVILINKPAVQSELIVVNMSLVGTMYTWKLVVHYFRKQPNTED